MCVRCHSGAGAPEGLQLDAAHSYALLVGVPSSEEPGVLRVQPGVPISDGAANTPVAGAAAARFAVVATFPEDQAVVVPPVARIVVAFSDELDISLINDTTVRLERLGTDALQSAGPIGNGHRAG